MARIAETAGISQTGLAHHFSTKLDLLVHVLTERDQHDQWLVTNAGPGHGWAHFDTLVALIEHNASRPGMVRLFTSVAGEAANPDHPAHDWFAEHYRAFHQDTEHALIQGIAAGQIRPDAPVQQISRLTAATIDGLQVQWLNDASLDMAQDFQFFVDALRLRWEVPSR